MDTNQSITHEDLSESIRSTALLADLTLNLWGAEKTDRVLTEQMREDAGAVGNVGRVIKNLLAGADTSLRATRAAYHQARAQHYALTLPWVANPHAERNTGPRLLPNMLFQRYLEAMSKAKRTAEIQRDSFLYEYPSLILQAQANLAGLANPSDYPSVDEVRACFNIAFDFEPIPTGQAFKGLPEHFLNKLSASLERKHTRMLEGSQRAMWEAVRSRVGHMVDRLSDQDAPFKAATVENVRELLSLLPAWDMTGDPRAAEVVQDINQMLHGVDARDLRKDAFARQDVAKQARAVTDKLSQWGL